MPSEISQTYFVDVNRINDLKTPIMAFHFDFNDHFVFIQNLSIFYDHIGTVLPGKQIFVEIIDFSDPLTPTVYSNFKTLANGVGIRQVFRIGLTLRRFVIKIGIGNYSNDQNDIGKSRFYDLFLDIVSLDNYEPR